jgi:hypothetical protein
LNHSRADLRVTGEAVTAWFRWVLHKEESDLVEVGELVIADAIDSVRAVRRFLKGT